MLSYLRAQAAPVGFRLSRRPLRRGSSRRIGAVLIAGVLLTMTAACTGTSRTDSDYRHKAANTAQALDSAVNIAELDAELVQRHKALSRELAVSVQQAYADGSSTVNGFDAVLPPGPAAARLQKRIDATLSAALDLLRDVRVQVGRGQEGALPSMIPDLRDASNRLKKFEQLA